MRGKAKAVRIMIRPPTPLTTRQVRNTGAANCGGLCAAGCGGRGDLESHRLAGSLTSAAGPRTRCSCLCDVDEGL